MISYFLKAGALTFVSLNGLSSGDGSEIGAAGKMERHKKYNHKT